MVLGWDGKVGKPVVPFKTPVVTVMVEGSMEEARWCEEHWKQKKKKERSVRWQSGDACGRSGRTKKKLPILSAREMFILFGNDGQPGKPAALRSIQVTLADLRLVQRQEL